MSTDKEEIALYYEAKNDKIRKRLGIKGGFYWRTAKKLSVAISRGVVAMDDAGFDKEDFKADHYSISDTLGELAKNEMANAIVQSLMAQASASRGDVAESVKDNPALQRMMQRMTLASLLKQAGDAVSEAQMKALNDALQKIPKN